MISHKHKCIFIHIPKCAGTSIESAFGHFDDYDGRGRQDHRTIRMIEPLSALPIISSYQNQQQLIRRVAHGLRKNPNVRNKITVTRQQYLDYFKFTIVRNPWSRAASVYMNVMRDEVHKKRHRVGNNAPMSEFLQDNVGKGLLRPQFDWITDWRGEIPLDFIGRLENLEQDFETICSMLGCGSIELPFINVNKNRTTPTYFDEDLNALVAKIYSKEIEYFGFRLPRR